MKVTFKGKPLIPSKYLESADLQGKRVPVVIESVHERAKLQGDKGEDETKPLFRLRGKEKGWVLNATNLESIAEIYGYDAEQWIGKTVVVYATKVKAFGETWMAIRVDEDATKARADAEKKNGNAKPAQAEPPHDPVTGEVAGDHDYGPAPMSEAEAAELEQ